MIACTSPTFTVRSRPFRIFLPPASTCRFFTSNKAIMFSLYRLRSSSPPASTIAASPTPTPFAIGLAIADHDANEGEDNRDHRHNNPIHVIGRAAERLHWDDRDHTTKAGAAAVNAQPCQVTGVAP